MSYLAAAVHAPQQYDLFSIGICMYCGRDIAAYSGDRREHHVNKCLDEYEKLYPPVSNELCLGPPVAQGAIETMDLGKIGQRASILLNSIADQQCK